MERTKPHRKFDQISKKRKAAEPEGLAPNVNEPSSSSSKSEKADFSFSGNVESKLKSIREIHTSPAGERNPHFSVHLSTELPKVSSTLQQPDDERQREFELKREKKRKKKSERFQAGQAQKQEGLIQNHSGV